MTHHHHSGGAHPSPAVPLSLLRLSLGKRIGIVAMLIATMWVAFFWATH